MKILLSFLYISISIIGLIILYRLLVRRLGRKLTNPDLYCELTSIDHQPVGGTIDFCFVCKETKNVNFDITDLNFNTIHQVASREFKSGQHILPFDSNQLSNGSYYYRIRTDNQQIFKKITIKND